MATHSSGVGNKYDVYRDDHVARCSGAHTFVGTSSSHELPGPSVSGRGWLCKTSTSQNTPSSTPSPESEVEPSTWVGRILPPSRVADCSPNRACTS